MVVCALAEALKKCPFAAAIIPFPWRTASLPIVQNRFTQGGLNNRAWRHGLQCFNDASILRIVTCGYLMAQRRSGRVRA
jgi:hypothetical protein